MPGINEIVLAVSFITLLKGTSPIAHATGFFYSSGDRHFFVSNQHVFIDPKKNLYPDKFRLNLHIDKNNVSKNNEYDISLYSNGKPLWKTHSIYQDADIALIEVNVIDLQKNGYLIYFLSKDSFLPNQYRLDPGEDVFIMGYPLSFFDTINNLPIFRNSMIASTYGVYFNNHPYFLTDANLHPGTSGSPVITKPKNIWIDDKGNANMKTGTVYYFIGVHSGTIDTSVTHGKAIGLGAAWYAQLVEDIASTF